MTLQKFFDHTHPEDENSIGYDFFIRPRIFCRDGFNLSVQANEGAYCQPRRMGKINYYLAEVGYPSAPEPLLTEFAEEQEVETVYAYVPVDVINQVLEKHGGIDIEKTFKQ